MVNQSERLGSDRSIFFVFLALLAWLPIPLGSNRPWAWALMETSIFIVAAIWLWGYWRGRNLPGPGVAQAWPALGIFFLWLLVVGLQTLPLPQTWVAVLSPMAAHLHAAPPGDAIGRGWITLSLDPYATRAGWLKSAAYGCFFVLALCMINSRHRLRQFACLMVFSGVMQAVIGGAAAFSEGSEAHGSFVNRNHYAGYLEMCIAVGIGLLISQLSGERLPVNWKGRLRELTRLMLSTKAIIRLCLVTMVIGLVLSRSRMGNTAFFSSLMIAGIISLMLSRYATRSMIIVIASLVIIDVLIIGSWFGVEKVKQRIEATTLATENRPKVYFHTIEYVKDFLLTGSGLGSFYTTFPRYRGGDVLRRNEHAEDDYLEISAETGLIGIGLLGSLVLVSTIATLLAHYRRRDPLLRGMSFASIMGITALLIHSTVDFNLQIPSNAVTFLMLLALGWICLGLPRNAD